MIQRVNVTVVVADQGGNPVAGAEVNAKLNRLEVGADAYVLPEEIDAVADENGIAVLQLWPSQLGSTASSYDFKILNPDTGKTERLTASIPNADCFLHEVANLPAFPGKTDGQLAIEAATAAVAPAQAAAAAAVAARDLAQVARAAADLDAAAAAGSADFADRRATGAATSENNALGYKNNAAASCSAAGVSAAAALASQGAAAGSATAAAGSATSAATSAGTATTKAGEALASAGAAAGSATTASTKATAANDSATAAAGSAGAASASATTASTKATDATNAATTATTKAGEAATSASGAATSATNAATSATNAAGSATTATTKAGEASTSAGNAATSATAAAGSATAAAGSATAANTSAGNAAGSATTANTAAGNASTSATTATTKAGEASDSAVLAKDWATKTAAPVSAGLYGAMKYAQDAQASANSAANSAAGVLAGQVNADWAVNDPASKAYIVNKPNLAAINAATAAALSTPRKINGVSFNGTADITLDTAPAGFTLTNGGDLIFRPGVNDDVGDLAWYNYSGTERHRLYDGGANGLYYRYNAGTAYPLVHAGNVGTVNAGGVNVQQGNEMVLANGFAGGALWMNFRGAAAAITQVNIGNGLAAGGLAKLNALNIDPTGNTTGNAASATKLANVRKIHGVNFDGTADISLPAALASPDGTAYQVGSGTDMNSLGATGFYRGQGFLNAPNGSTGWFYVVNEVHDGSWIKQTATAYGSGNVGGETYQRVKISNTWGAWVQITDGAYDERYVLKRRKNRYNAADSTSINNIANPETGFDYDTGGAGITGPFLHFGGLAGYGDYSCQIVANYTGTQAIKVRTRNNDVQNAPWNGWVSLFHSGNLNPQVTAIGNSVVQRDANGYLRGNYINMSDDADSPNPVTGIIVKKGDDYYRTGSAVNVKNFLGIPGFSRAFDTGNTGSGGIFMLLATLPASSVGSKDSVLIDAVVGGWESNNKAILRLYFANRNAFMWSWDSAGGFGGPAGVCAYTQADGSVNIYGYANASGYYTFAADVRCSTNASIGTGPQSAVAPTGNLVFDSQQPATYKPRFSVDFNGNATFNGNGTFSGALLKPTIWGYIEKLQTQVPGAAITLDPQGLGTLIKITTTVANTTITLPARIAGMSYTVIVKYGAAGHTVTFVAAAGDTLSWGAAGIPAATSVAGKRDKYVYTCDDEITMGQDGGRGF